MSGQMSDDAFISLFLNEDAADKLGLDIYADLILNTAVDTGTLRNAWEIEQAGGQTVITNPLPYAETVMENGHSSQTAPNTLSNIVDKYNR